MLVKVHPLISPTPCGHSRAKCQSSTPCVSQPKDRVGSTAAVGPGVQAAAAKGGRPPFGQGPLRCRNWMPTCVGRGRRHPGPGTSHDSRRRRLFIGRRLTNGHIIINGTTNPRSRMSGGERLPVRCPAQWRRWRRGPDGWARSRGRRTGARSAGCRGTAPASRRSAGRD